MTASDPSYLAPTLPPTRWLALLAASCSLALAAQPALAHGKAHHPRAGHVVHHVAPHHVAHASHAVRATAHRHALHAQAGPARRHAAAVAAVPPVPQRLELKSTVAYVVDQETGNVVLQKNADAVVPIASLTKLMTGVVIAEAQLPPDEKITITDDDVDHIKFSSSHLPVGTVLTRREALHLALMASENRAAHALARTYPGGESAFVSAMNNKARQLGMDGTGYVEPTGLSSQNQSSARDLAALAAAADQYPLLREFTTSPEYRVGVAGGATRRFGNTDMLVRDPSWHIGLQKTGFINEAGQCLLLQTRMLGRHLLMVFLHSRGTLARIRDAQQVRLWFRAHPELLQHAAEAQARTGAQPES